MSKDFTQRDRFIKSLRFIKSDQFQDSLDFTKSDQFSESFDVTSNIKLTMSNSFSESNILINPNIPPQSTKPITYSNSYILSFISKEFGTLSISLTVSNTSYISFFEKKKNSYSMIISQTGASKFYPYIIRFYWPSYYYTIILMTLDIHKDKISPEQLIVLICESTPVFFLILANINFVIRKK